MEEASQPVFFLRYEASKKGPGFPGALSLSKRVFDRLGIGYQYFAITGPPQLKR